MKKNITVLGSFVVDIMGRCPRIPQKGETVKGSYCKIGPGGKGSNQAIASLRTGGNVNFITKMGDDLFSSVALDFYKTENLDTSYIFQDKLYSTGIALISVEESSKQNSIVVLPGACEHISESDLKQVDDILANTDYFLTQLETNIDILSYAVDKVHSNLGFAILNPAPAQTLDLDILSKFDLITPNETEASFYTDIDVKDELSAEKAADKFIEMGIKNVLITLGSKGCFYKSANKVSRFFPSFSVDVVDTTGAGDAFNGGLVTALSEGKDMIDAIIFAMTVASLAVTKIGTAPAMPYRKDVDAFINNL